jgi:hypothetical protein
MYAFFIEELGLRFEPVPVTPPGAISSGPAR